MDFRRRIIDVFINSIYLYDDRVVIFYNIRGGKQVSYIDLLAAEEAPEPEEKGSDMKANGRPDDFKSEPKYVFINGIFGCVFYRSAEEK